MRTIFVKIQEGNHNKGIVRTRRYAISLDRRSYSTIGDWLEYVIRVCQLDNDNWQLSLDGYRIANSDTTKMLEDHHTYVICREEEEKEEEGGEDIRESKKQQKKVKVAQKKREAQQRRKRSSSSSEIQSSEEEDQRPPKFLKKSKVQKFLKNKAASVTKSAKKARVVRESSSGSSSSSGEELPTISRKIPPPKIPTISKPPPNKPPLQAKKKPIRISPSESSDESTPKPPPKVNTPSNSVPPKRVPAALRNQQAPPKPSAYRSHQQNQWLPVSRQQLKQWREMGHVGMCQAGNRIRFRVMELDQERFVPVRSEWIVGEVAAVGEDGKVELKGVEQEGHPYRSHYALPEHNMDQLQIHRTLATPQQLSLLTRIHSNTPKNNLQVPQQTPPTTVVPPQNPSKQKGGGSLQAYICGQVNYYFSQKNYNTDLYMQMHANRHPNKELPYNFLLNFPKIKKVLNDQHKLAQYLQNDPKYSQRNYVIDTTQKTIKKKQTQQVSEVKSKSKEKQEGEAVCSPQDRKKEEQAAEVGNSE